MLQGMVLLGGQGFTKLRNAGHTYITSPFKGIPEKLPKSNFFTSEAFVNHNKNRKTVKCDLAAGWMYCLIFDLSHV